MRRKCSKCSCAHVCLCQSPGKDPYRGENHSRGCRHQTVWMFSCVCTGKMDAYFIGWCIVCVRVAVIHWPGGSSWGSAHIAVITAVLTADWLFSALLRRCQSVSLSHCWSQAKVNTPQCQIAFDDLWSPFYDHAFTLQTKVKVWHNTLHGKS